jgi:hypothetical protein
MSDFVLGLKTQESAIGILLKQARGHLVSLTCVALVQARVESKSKLLIWLGGRLAAVGCFAIVVSW